jgi:NitT/TauT family transport system substrate-binding protein
MAKANGVDFNKIQFVNLSPPDAITALAKGDIDAMAAWAPWTFRAVKEASGKVFYTRILEDVDPALVKWRAKTEVK